MHSPRQWLLIRHGETAWNRARRIQGQTDVPLNRRGRAQARALAPLLRGQAVDLILVSDLKRARATARLALPGTHAPLVATRRLREIHYGRLEGMTVEEADTWMRSNRGMPLRDRDPARALPGGESFRSLLRRVKPLLRLAGRRAPAGSVIVVAHMGVVRAFLTLLLRRSPAGFTRIPVPSGSLTALRRGARSTRYRVFRLTLP